MNFTPCVGDELACGRHRHAGNPSLSERERPAGLEFPKRQGTAAAAVGQILPVRREPKVLNHSSSVERRCQSALRKIPNSDLLIVRSRRQLCAVGRDRDGLHAVREACERVEPLTFTSRLKIIPLESPKVRLSGRRQMPGQQTLSQAKVSRGIGLMHQVHVCRVKQLSGGQLLRLGPLTQFLRDTGAFAGRASLEMLDEQRDARQKTHACDDRDQAGQTAFRRVQAPHGLAGLKQQQFGPHIGGGGIAVGRVVCARPYDHLVQLQQGRPIIERLEILRQQRKILAGPAGDHFV